MKRFESKRWFAGVGVLPCLMLVVMQLASPSIAAEKLPPPAAWIPSEAVFVFQVTDPEALIDRAFSDDVVQLVTSHPLYRQAMSQPDAAKAVDFVKFIEFKQNAKLQEILRRLTGGGITLAVGPHEEALLMIDARDAQTLADVHELILNMAKGGPGQGNVASAEYKGVTGWTVGDNEAHAIIENRFILTNKREILKAIVDVSKGESSIPTLQDNDQYQTAMAAVSDAPVRMYANLEALKQAPGFGKGMKDSDNPLTRLLFAPLLDAIQQAHWLAAGLQFDGGRAALQFVADGSPSEASAFAVPQAGHGAMPNLEVPRQIAAFSLYRDLHRFYAAKDQLFPERTSGLIFFENMMGIFFTGRDLTEEVLAETGPDVRLVVAEQQFDKQRGIPAPQFPGFALVIQLKHPEQFQPVVEEAWQKAIGLVNFTRGQNALPGLIIDKAVEGKTKYTTASFSSADEENREAVDVRFNFQPSIAVQGDHLILASSDELTRTLIDALTREDAGSIGPEVGRDLIGELNGPALRSILQANQDILVRQNMVEKGHSGDEAQAEISALLGVLDYLQQISISTAHDQGLTRLRLDLKYQLK